VGDLLLPTELLVGVAVLLVVAAGAVFARRRLIARGEPLILCGLRERGSHRWQVGLARYSINSLYWYTLAGPSMRPRRRWPRTLLELGPTGTVPRAQVDQRLAVMPHARVVECQCAGERFQLALDTGPHTALVSWLEAAPPAQDRHVA